MSCLHAQLMSDLNTALEEKYVRLVSLASKGYFMFSLHLDPFLLHFASIPLTLHASIRKVLIYISAQLETLKSCPL